MNCLCGRRRAAGGQVHDGLLVHVRPGDLALEGAVVQNQGVDVGAKEEIYDIILRLAREGVAVVVLSSEAQEIIRVCDRALVLYLSLIHI